jgi:hypothetical protein
MNSPNKPHVQPALQAFIIDKPRTAEGNAHVQRLIDAGCSSGIMDSFLWTQTVEEHEFWDDVWYGLNERLQKKRDLQII